MDNYVTTIAWALLEVKVSPEKTSYKVIAECYDPQENKVSWRLSSDILGIKLVDNKYLVDTRLGCVYVCDTNYEDMTITQLLDDSIKALEESFEIKVVNVKYYQNRNNNEQI